MARHCVWDGWGGGGGGDVVNGGAVNVCRCSLVPKCCKGTLGMPGFEASVHVSVTARRGNG